LFGWAQFQENKNSKNIFMLQDNFHLDDHQLFGSVVILRHNIVRDPLAWDIAVTKKTVGDHQAGIKLAQLSSDQNPPVTIQWLFHDGILMSWLMN